MPYSEGRSRRSMLLLAGLAVFVSTAIGQQAPTSSVDVNAVNVVATVHDKHGNIINDLSQKDFILEEDGRPQAIRSFSREVDLPLTVGLLIDTSSSQRPALEPERSASGHFIDQVLRENDQDKAFLIHFDREVELLQDLTPSKQKLNDALDLLPQQQFKRDEGDSSNGDEYPRSRGASGRSLISGTLLYDSVYLASNELMLKQQGSKALVVLSDGVDRGSKVTLERAIESAQRANTIVYSILIPALQSPGSEGGRGRGITMGGPMGGPMGRRSGGYPGSPKPPQDHINGKKILERISMETGGRMFDVSKEAARNQAVKETIYQIYQKIREDLRNQYSLGYVPDSTGNPSEYRKIHVTTIQKNFVVQARDGYYPAKQLAVKKDKEQN
ncbi:MAG: VWA domain-containing protein [Candidatus Korobacteraceae bacterium]